MDLDRRGRDHLRLELSTEPEVDSWEASFDDGETWKPGSPGTWTAEDGREVEGWLWLLAGPDVAQGSAVAQLPLGQHEVLVAATDTAVRLVRSRSDRGRGRPPGPKIFVNVT